MSISMCTWFSSLARVLFVGVGWGAEGRAFGVASDTKMLPRQKDGGRQKSNKLLRLAGRCPATETGEGREEQALLSLLPDAYRVLNSKTR